MENLFEKLKKDMKKGLEEGLTVLMKGANVVSLKMSELSEEGKRQYKMFNLHVKIRDELNRLGDLAYDALKNMRSLDEDKKIRAAYLKIKKLEWQLGRFESGKKIKKAVSGKAAKKAHPKASVKQPGKKVKRTRKK